MAILYGTTGDGTTLPVLVDQFGNLLAKGIDGEPGTPGTPGTPGEPGPPGADGADGGSFPLPSDPYEGALLGWLNNELAWIGTPPVPIPEGVFGPITSWDSGGLLAVEGEIPLEIAQGVFIYQCNQDGTIFVDGWNNLQNWSDATTYDTSKIPASAFAKLFDGVPTNSVQANQGSTTTLSWNNGVIGGNEGDVIRIFFQGNITTVAINGVDRTISQYAWNTVSENYLTALEVKHPSGGSISNPGAIELNGFLLVDNGDYPTAPNLNFRVQSVSGQNMIGVANRTDDFTIGKYLRVPEQNVARWLYDGNLSKVITSTGIDISRLTEN